jgi:CRISPR/Cas system endoribonuclease Cas6 (RAMP superfamily)
MPPSLMARFTVKHGYNVRRTRVAEKLAQGRHAAAQTGRALYGVKTANEIECINNK